MLDDPLTPLEPVFAEYERLAAQVDSLFAGVRDQYPEAVACGDGCSDCCHALFDLSLIEALYLHRAFTRRFDFGKERSNILERADAADRAVYVLKRRLHKESTEGRTPEELARAAGAERLRCPLLSEDDRCVLYDQRPLTCRAYGLPLSIDGVGRACPRSRFDRGGSYPALDMDKVNAYLAELSVQAAQLLKSRFTELHTVYVPVSTALLADYDAEYLGINQKGEQDERA